MCAQIADETEMLRPLGIAAQKRTFVMPGNAFRKKRPTDSDIIVVAIGIDEFVSGPDSAYVVQNDIAAVLYGEGVACAFFGSRTIDPHPDMPNDDVMCLFDADRRDTVRDARLGTSDAPGRGGLPG